ncbi:MAG: sodium ion-translocating decarboxylase subunit beta [Anaerolineales bacterium]|nr:sodium ion-translocating decarboxylase subunit beta [Anaerolineales bacterium]
MLKRSGSFISLAAAVAVTAFSYMSLVPIIQPPVMRLLTTKAERRIRMPYNEHPVNKRTRVVFPIVVTLLTGFLAPQASPLIGTLMFGNLMRESGVVDRLVKTAGNELANITTIFLGITIGATMVGESFANLQTLIILVLGILAFALDTAAGVLFGKLLNLITRGRFNPLIGAAGISAFPMAARVVNRVGLEEDYDNFLLMHAMGANTAGQIASVVAGGVVLAFFGAGVWGFLHTLLASKVVKSSVQRTLGDNGETRVTIDGVDQHDNTIPLVDDRQEHTVEVRIPVGLS